MMLKVLLTCLGLIIFSNRVFSQNPRQAGQLLAEGNKLMDAGNYREAGNYYIKAVDADTLNLEANLMAGISLLNYSKAKALQYLIRVHRMDSTYRPDISYLVGRSLQSAYRFSEAISYYSDYTTFVRNNKLNSNFPAEEGAAARIEECRNGIRFLQNPQPIQIKNLGSAVNSVFSDYGPVLDAEQSVLIFTSRRKENNTNSSNENGLYYEDIYYSTFEDSVWSAAKNVGPPVNSLYHESVICLSPFGDKLYIYKDTGEGDIFVSNLLQQGWSEPVPFQALNSPYSERSMTISAGGNTIIFSSNRPGGVGGFDLYRIIFDGTYWSKPQNLGKRINTIHDEDSPAFGHDNKSIYFSSKGWQGMGGFDIFVTDPEKSEEPVNLGIPVNTPEDDVYFVPVANGTNAYFASTRSEGFGELDIYFLQSLNGVIGGGGIRKETDEILSANKPRLENLYFEFGRTKLLDLSQEKLDANIEYLSSNPSAEILLIGHTDNIGSDDENSILAMERAMQVALFLKENGISEKRIKLEAKGECCPIVSNDDPDKIYMNRRVEFVIIRE